MRAGCQHITQTPITNKKVEWDGPCARCGEILHWVADMTGPGGIIEYEAISKGEDES